MTSSTLPPAGAAEAVGPGVYRFVFEYRDGRLDPVAAPGSPPALRAHSAPFEVVGLSPVQVDTLFRTLDDPGVHACPDLMATLLRGVDTVVPREALERLVRVPSRDLSTRARLLLPLVVHRVHGPLFELLRKGDDAAAAAAALALSNGPYLEPDRALAQLAIRRLGAMPSIAAARAPAAGSHEAGAQACRARASRLPLLQSIARPLAVRHPALP